MTTQFQHLFTPLKLGSTTIRNRIVNPPHGTRMADANGEPTEKMAHYFAERAKGGVGLIVMAGSIVLPNGMSSRGIVTSDEKVIPGLRKIAGPVHGHGVKIFAQLSHQGRQVPSIHHRLPLWAPSPLPCPTLREIPKEMEAEDIAQLIEAHGRGARNVRAGEYDGVEIFAAQGYLLNEFLSPHTNKRMDQYGGSPENRMRLILEIIDRVRKEVGSDFVVGLRMNADDLTPGGLTIEDTREIATKIEATGKIDYLSISGGTGFRFPLWIADMASPVGVGAFAALAGAIKEVVSLPVMCTNGIRYPALAEKILANGQADMVGMVRPLICDPELPNKAREGRLEDIRRCIACNQGCLGRTQQGASLSCIHNPAVGQEKELGMGTLKPATIKKKVVVVGGGPAGMEAARIAAERGHEVVLFESEKELGGQVNMHSKVKSWTEFQEVARFLSHQVGKLGVKVKLGCKANVEDVEMEKPDSVVVATGSIPLRSGYSSFRPELSGIPGVEQKNVVTVTEVFQDRERIGKNIVLIDEDPHLQTIPTAEYLADQGKKVEIVTREVTIGRGLAASFLPSHYERLFKKGVKITPHSAVKEITGRTVTLFNIYTNEERKISGVDNVVLVMGNAANNELYRALKGRVKELYAIGDCVAPRIVDRAILEGNRVGRII
ncbi:MAG: FAD-dependent oxidoreductase [Betaproteobacteria bacterium]|nr:FAD-dependent oxidoreductase [Betaproteobacteria bacterium]